MWGASDAGVARFYNSLFCEAMAASLVPDCRIGRKPRVNCAVGLIARGALAVTGCGVAK
jgi:hypothetical protein